MRFTTVLAMIGIVPAVMGVALPTEKRAGSTSTIVKAVNEVNEGIQDLDKTVRNVTSADLTQFLAVQSQATVLTDTITSAQSQVESAGNLDIIGSLAVEVAATQLVSSVQKLSKDLINIKSFADQAGVTATVLSTVQSQKTSADNFADVLLSKVPSLLQGIAGISKTQIDDALNQVIEAYSSSSTTSTS